MNPQEQRKGKRRRQQIIDRHNILKMKTQGGEGKGVREEESTRSKPVHASEFPGSLRNWGCQVPPKAEMLNGFESRTSDCKSMCYQHIGFLLSPRMEIKGDNKQEQKSKSLSAYAQERHKGANAERKGTGGWLFREWDCGAFIRQRLGRRALSWHVEVGLCLRLHCHVACHCMRCMYH